MHVLVELALAQHLEVLLHAGALLGHARERGAEHAGAREEVEDLAAVTSGVELAHALD
jgi:hypothetical protein